MTESMLTEEVTLEELDPVVEPVLDPVVSPVASQNEELAEEGGRKGGASGDSSGGASDCSTASEALPTRNVRGNGRGVDAVAGERSTAPGQETRVSWQGAGDIRYRDGVLVEAGNDVVPTRRAQPHERPSSSRRQRGSDDQWFAGSRGRAQRRAAGPSRRSRQEDRTIDQVAVMARRLTAMVDTGRQRREHVASQRSRIEEIRELLERLPRPNRHGRGTHLASWCPFNAKRVWRGTPLEPSYMGAARNWSKEGRSFPAEDYPRPYILEVREKVANLFSDELNTYAQFIGDYAVAVRRIVLRLEQIGLAESFAWRDETRQAAVDRVSFRPTIEGRTDKLREIQFHVKLRFGEATKYGKILAGALEKMMERASCEPFSVDMAPSMTELQRRCWFLLNLGRSIEGDQHFAHADSSQ